MFQEELKEFVLNNPKLVTMRESISHPGLFVLKYSKRVFYDGLWNNFLENCRGTIVDSEFNVVTRTFQKIYNFRVESQAPEIADSTDVTAYEKTNGFFVALSSYNGRMIVSTTGSTDSSFVDMAKEMMQLHMPLDLWETQVNKHAGYTLMFEAVHPNDPHIVPETAGMYFLGARANTWDSITEGYGYINSIMWRNMAVYEFNCNPIACYYTTMGEVVAMSKEIKHEGFVIYTKDNQSTKIKSPHYLISKALARKKDIMSLNKQLVDEEYYPLVSHLNSMKDEFNAMPEQDRLAYIRNFLVTV